MRIEGYYKREVQSRALENVYSEVLRSRDSSLEKNPSFSLSSLFGV